jgi:hypothetical protein
MLRVGATGTNKQTVHTGKSKKKICKYMCGVFRRRKEQTGQLRLLGRRILNERCRLYQLLKIGTVWKAENSCKGRRSFIGCSLHFVKF